MIAAEDSQCPSNLITQVEKCWPIGSIKASRRIKRGLVNQTFRIDTVDRQTHILRLYHPDITAKRIRNEHDLLHRLDQVGFSQAPRLIVPFEPPTWKTLPTPHGGHRHMALMTHLPGEDRYTWDGPPQHAYAAKALGDALARYHLAIQGWGTETGDPVTDEMDVLRRLAMNLKTEPQALATLTPLQSALVALNRRSWPALVVHGDFHAANVRWSGDRITGLFDFEYADLNWRLYDVATAIACQAFVWSSVDEGQLQKDLMQAFLDGYQGGLDHPSHLPHLLPGELAALPCYLALAHLLTLEWALSPGTQRRLGAATAHRYTRHAKKALEWLRQRDAPI